MIHVKWKKDLYYKNQLRKTFSSFQIPAEIRDLYSFNDGQILNIDITFGNKSYNDDYKLTSGCEIHLSKDISEQVSAFAKTTGKNTIIYFSINLKETKSSNKIYQKDYFDKFELSLEESLNVSSSKRIERISAAQKLPGYTVVEHKAYLRNSDIVAEKLLRAKGICEDCGAKAPFFKKSDGTPYLEVHHIISLASGGEDTLENTVALCPNCHRKRHFG